MQASGPADWAESRNSLLWEYNHKAILNSSTQGLADAKRRYIVSETHGADSEQLQAALLRIDAGETMSPAERGDLVWYGQLRARGRRMAVAKSCVRRIANLMLSMLSRCTVQYRRTSFTMLPVRTPSGLPLPFYAGPERRSTACPTAWCGSWGVNRTCAGCRYVRHAYTCAQVTHAVRIGNGSHGHSLLHDLYRSPHMLPPTFEGCFFRSHC